MNIKINLTKKQLIKLVLFVSVIGAAALFDSNFDKNTVPSNEVDTNTKDRHNEQNSVYLFSQLNIPSVKIEVQKPAFRKVQPKLHDRFIQKYHQVRNYQVFKAETEPKTSPMISDYRYLAFKNYFYTDPDDDHPLVS